MKRNLHGHRGALFGRGEDGMRAAQHPHTLGDADQPQP